MRKSNSKEARRAVETYVLDKIAPINERAAFDGTLDDARPVTSAFNTLLDELAYQSTNDRHNSHLEIMGAELARKYEAAGRRNHITADNPYRVWQLYALNGNVEPYTDDQREALAEWMDETPEEAARYSADQVDRLFCNLTASAFERLYQRELAGTPATIAPALTGTEEFHIVFQQSRMVLFYVSYYTLGSNRTPYFTTQANRYNQNKSDIVEGGQAQDRLTTGKIRAFWKKWDPHHLQQLTDEERRELANDLESLKSVYNHIQFTADKSPHCPTINERRALSMQKISRNAAREA